LNEGEESKSILEAGQKDAEYVEQFCAEESDKMSGNYLLYETTVKCVEFTTESINQLDYAGKYAEKETEPEKRPRWRALELKQFVENGFENVSSFSIFNLLI
jgi:hypothetical protein